ncbi:hypothetical protein D9758_009628 [Tetrapyrgos nigripes]|uniref:Uncharacterized protein n=1 Tax=Tetrapyrgos nigripes TaxID=182062 RepID=A0A8H5GCR8_9AGAR|nr:hypothetical protein D9758_009628 [Tetrapyrgos nigripes]
MVKQTHITSTKGISQSQARLVLTSLAIFMLLTTTVCIALTAQIIIETVPLTFGARPGPGTIALSKTEEIVSLLTDSSIALNFFDRVNYVISDAIVVWRAWILFPQNRSIKLVLFICMLASCAGTLTDFGLATQRKKHNLSEDGSGASLLILTIPLLFTNLVATGLIGYKTWFHLKDIKQNIDSSTHSASKVYKILLLLLESGLFYSALWATYIVLGTLPLNAPFGIYGSAMTYLAALYPIIIIIIAAIENIKPESHTMDCSYEMRFASVHVGIQSDSESLD